MKCITNYEQLLSVKDMSLEELQSKVIDFLRFPLIVGVVFIHNYRSLGMVREIEYESITLPRSLELY